MKKNLLKKLKSQGLGLKRGELSFVETHNWLKLAAKVVDDIGEDLQHIGSTAVPNIITKPILDFLLTYKGQNLTQETIEKLEKLGFTYKGDMVSKANKLANPDDQRHFFAFYDNEMTTDFIHIHALPEAHPECQKLLDFRDALRASKEKRELYNEFKRKSVEGSVPREKYRELKTEVVEKILK